MKLLNVKEVVSGYGKIPILHEVSLHVNEGEIVSVIGPNGAGKSTLMGTISGLLPVMKGEIQFQGRNITGWEPSRIAEAGLGYVPQRRNVFAELTVIENLQLGGYTLKRSKEALEHVLELFPDLKGRLRQPAGTLSGGQRQMLALASALMVTPKLLLLDEPITGLAPQIIEGLVDMIVRIRETGTTILWVVEENPRQVLQHADRVYLMDAGGLKSEFRSEELIRHEDFEALFLGTKG